MDNDNKIEKSEVALQTHNEVLLFLNDELDKIQQTSQTKSYNLVEEYAKTKNHKSPFVLILLVSCFLSVGGIAFVMNSVISRHNDEITVNLQEFDDLNLKTLLDSVSKVQTNYDEAVKNKAALQANFESELEQAEAEYKNNLFVLDSMRIPSADKKKRLAGCEEAYNENLKLIHEKYDSRISAADKEVQSYASQLAEFDTAKVDSAREQQKAFDAERQLQEMERQKMASEYEGRIADLKKNIADIRVKYDDELRNSVNSLNLLHKQELAEYDPVITDEQADSIVQNINKSEIIAFDSDNYMEEDGNNDDKVVRALEEFQKLYDDYSYLDSKYANLPYKNSVVTYRNASNSIVDEMGQVLVTSTEGLVEDKKQLNSQIADRDNQISDYKKEIIKKNEEIANFDKALQTEYEWFGDCLEGILTFANTNAVVLQVNDYDDTAVYVAKKARYLIPQEGGLGAEIRAQKVIKGRIYREVEEEDEDDYFYFVPDRDRNGNKIEIDFSTLIPGTAIKLLSK